MQKAGVAVTAKPENERQCTEDAAEVGDVAGFRLFIVYDGHACKDSVSIVRTICTYRKRMWR